MTGEMKKPLNILLAIAHVFLLPGSFALGADSIFTVQNRSSTPNFQLFLNLDTDGSIVMTGPLYGPAGGVYGLAFLGEILYAVELENGTGDEYLATIPHQGAFGQGSRVAGGANPVGYSNVEGLAVADGVIYATSLDFTGHRTRLITIDAGTGVGTLVGTGSTDAMIVGLAFDPNGDVLYGAGIPFATANRQLYTINRATGATAPIAPLNVAIQGLAWDSVLGLIGAFEKLYQINTQTGATTQVGSEDFTDNQAGPFNGLYGLATLIPAASDPPEPAEITDLEMLGENVRMTWKSIAGFDYGVETTTDLSADNWSLISGSRKPATGSVSDYTHVGGGGGAFRFYRIVTYATNP